MADERYITQAEADAAKQQPIVTRGQPNQPPGIAPFFVEEVRKHLEQQYGAKVLYENGLSVTTTLDARLQELANKALEHGLRALDKRHGYRKPTRNVIAERHTIDGFKDERWTRPIAAGDIVPAVVVTAPKTGAGAAAHRRLHADLDKATATPGRARRRPADLFKPGDLIDVRDHQDRRGDRRRRRSRSSRRRSSKARSLAIDNRTGQIKAMVGGWSFARSKFNRAVQAYRQLGSTFKPIVYTAAIDRGFTPSSILVDAPVSYSAGNGQIYSPHNYDHKFEGPITLRHALEESRNIPAIKMMDTLGPKNVLEYAKRFGFEEDFPPYLPIALGAGDATLLEMTSAYTVVPESGRAHEAVRRADGQGSRRQPARGEPRRAERRHPRRHRVRDDEPAARRAGPRGTGARARRWRRRGRWPARPARSTTTPTRGSSASIRTSPSASGSGSTTRSRSAPPSRARSRRCRSGWSS